MCVCGGGTELPSCRWLGVGGQTPEHGIPGNLLLGWGSRLECFAQVCAASQGTSSQSGRARAGGALGSSPSGRGGLRSAGRLHAVSLRLSCALLLRPHTTTRGTLLPAEVGVFPGKLFCDTCWVPTVELDSDTSSWRACPSTGKGSVPQGSSHSDAHRKSRLSPCSRPMGCKSEVASTLL